MSKRYTQTKMQQRLNTPTDQRKPLGKPMKENNFWSELTQTYNNAVEASNAMGREIIIAVMNVSQDEEKLKFVKDQQALANCVDLINKDISSHQAALLEINKKQLEQHGGTGDDPDNHMLVLALNGEYADQVAKFNAIFMDTTKVIEEILNNALSEYLSSEKAKSNLTDPSVITDVEFKEVS